MKSKYAYLVWLTIMLTSWLSALVSLWIAIAGNTRYFYFAVFWLILVVLLPFIPGASKK